MHAYKTDLSIAQTTPQSSSYIFYTGTKKREMSHKWNTSSWVRTTDDEVRGTATYLLMDSASYMTIYQIDMYLQGGLRRGGRSMLHIQLLHSNNNTVGQLDHGK